MYSSFLGTQWLPNLQIRAFSFGWKSGNPNPENYLYQFGNLRLQLWHWISNCDLFFLPVLDPNEEGQREFFWGGFWLNFLFFFVLDWVKVMASSGLWMKYCFVVHLAAEIAYLGIRMSMEQSLLRGKLWECNTGAWIKLWECIRATASINLLLCEYLPIHDMVLEVDFIVAIVTVN